MQAGLKQRCQMDMFRQICPGNKVSTQVLAVIRKLLFLGGVVELFRCSEKGSTWM